MKEITFENIPVAIQELNAKVDRLLILLQTDDPEKKDNDLILTEEAAELLNLSINTVYAKVSKREIPFMKRGKRLYFSKSELTNFIKSGKVMTLGEIEENTSKLLSNFRN